MKREKYLYLLFIIPGVFLFSCQGKTTSLFRLLKQGAAQENPAAEFELGMFYLNGSQIRKSDPIKGATWIRKAADHGYLDAQDILGSLYYSGLGVPKDETQAVQWWQIAANQGSKHAQSWLSQAFAEGRGTDQDYYQAYFWNLIGSFNKSSPEINARKAIEKNLTSLQIAKAKQQARTWQPTPSKTKAVISAEFQWPYLPKDDFDQADLDRAALRGRGACATWLYNREPGFVSEQADASPALKIWSCRSMVSRLRAERVQKTGSADPRLELDQQWLKDHPY